MVENGNRIFDTRRVISSKQYLRYKKLYYTAYRGG